MIGGTVRTLARMHLRACGIQRRSRRGLRLQQSDLTAIREKLRTGILPDARVMRPETAQILIECMKGK